MAPNACVIQNNHPQFLSVNDLIKSSAELTRELLKRELKSNWRAAGKMALLLLGEIFIEIYRDIERKRLGKG